MNLLDPLMLLGGGTPGTSQIADANRVIGCEILESLRLGGWHSNWRSPRVKSEI